MSKYIKRDDVDYVEEKGANISPHRLGDVKVNREIEVIANYVDKISHVDVVFAGTTFTLSFNRYSNPSDVFYLRQNVEAEFDQLIADIATKLRDEGYKSTKIELISLDIDGIAWTTFRTVNYACRATFETKQ